MWCGFCGAYTGTAKREECPQDCSPPPLEGGLAALELDPQGTE